MVKRSIIASSYTPHSSAKHCLDYLYNLRYTTIVFRLSSVVEQFAVNEWVAGSSPAAGAMKNVRPFGLTFFIPGLPHSNQRLASLFRDSRRVGERREVLEKGSVTTLTAVFAVPAELEEYLKSPTPKP